MGLFKSMKDMAELTKQGKQMQEQQQRDAGYKPGMGGSMAQMGDMLGQANEQLKELSGVSGDRDRLLAEGIDGEGVIVGHGAPARGAQWFNLDIDMEIHVPGRKTYQVNNEYMVPNGATLGPGVRLPVKVDPEDQTKIAIDWDSAEQGPGARRGPTRRRRGLRLRRGARGSPLGRRRRHRRGARAAGEAARLRRPHRRRVRAAEGEDPRRLARPSHASSSCGGRSAPPGSGRSPTCGPPCPRPGSTRARSS